MVADGAETEIPVEVGATLLLLLPQPTPAGNGLWKIHLDLPHGRHEYVFVVDGHWETDPSVPATVDDGFGSKNTLLLL